MSRTDAEIAEAMTKQATAETEIDKRDRKVTGGSLLLSAAELHKMARSGALPGAFAERRKSLKAANDAASQEREAMHDLIREAHRQGVGPAVLARWSGYDPSRIYQILGQ